MQTQPRPEQCEHLHEVCLETEATQKCEQSFHGFGCSAGMLQRERDSDSQDPQGFEADPVIKAIFI